MKDLLWFRYLREREGSRDMEEQYDVCRGGLNFFRLLRLKFFLLRLYSMLRLMLSLEVQLILFLLL